MEHDLFPSQQEELGELSISFSSIQVSKLESERQIKREAEVLLGFIQSQTNEVQESQREENEEKIKKICDEWTLIKSGDLKTFKPLYKSHFKIKQHNS
mgnify:CR=1 FL=1